MPDDPAAKKEEAAPLGDWPPHKHEDLIKIAKGLRSGEIFCDRHLRRHEDIQMVFMVLFFITEQSFFDRLKAFPPGMMYEWLDKAAPRGVNGYPCFFSAHILNRADTDTVMQMIKTLDEAEKMAVGVLETLKPPTEEACSESSTPVTTMTSSPSTES